MNNIVIPIKKTAIRNMDCCHDEIPNSNQHLIINQLQILIPRALLKHPGGNARDRMT